MKLIDRIVLNTKEYKKLQVDLKNVEEALQKVSKQCERLYVENHELEELIDKSLSKVVQVHAHYDPRDHKHHVQILFDEMMVRDMKRADKQLVQQLARHIGQQTACLIWESVGGEP
jgi:predicted nuclease with TOPRIM domain